MRNEEHSEETTNEDKIVENGSFEITENEFENEDCSQSINEARHFENGKLSDELMKTVIWKL